MIGPILFFAVVLMLCAIELAKTVRAKRAKGNQAYRDQVDAIIDEVLPKEQAAPRWVLVRLDQP